MPIPAWRPNPWPVPTKTRPKRNPLISDSIISNNNFTANISSVVWLTSKLRRIKLPCSYLRKKYLTKCIVDNAIHIAL